MVVEAISLLGDRPKVSNVKIVSVTGPSMEATKLIKGYAMKNKVIKFFILFIVLILF